MEPSVAVIDHGSEINIISSDFYNRGRWPIERKHGWKVRAATEVVEDLCGACPNIKVTLGNHVLAYAVATLIILYMFLCYLI